MAKPGFDPNKAFEVVEEKKPPFDPSKSFQVLDEPVAPGPIGAEKLETAARSALEGATFGVSEPILSGVNATIGNLIDAGFDAESLKDFFSKSIDTTRLQKEYAADVARRKGLEAALPQVATGAEIAGALISPVGRIGKGLSLAGKGIVAGAERLVTPIAEALPVQKLLPEALTKAGEKVAESTAQAVLGSELKKAAEIPTGFMAPEAALKPEEVATTTAAITAGLEALPLVGKGLKAGGAKALSAFGGVPEKTIKAYLKREEPLLPMTTEALKDKVDEAVNKVQAALVEQRKQAADDVLVAVKALKDKVIKGSQESYDILEKAGIETAKKGAEKVIKADDILASIDKQIAAQRQKTGDILINPLRENVANKLTDLRDRISSLKDQIGENFDLPTAKQVIQGLDEITEFSQAEGTFSSRLDNALKTIRSGLNSELRKLSPEYAKKMDEVAQDARLLETASNLFGTEKGALSAIQTLAVGKNPSINALALNLEKATGVSISKGINAIKRTMPVERLDPKTTQAFLKGVMGGRSIEGRRTLGLLSQLADDDLVKLADDAAMSADFEKLTMNGSRDVNFWKEMLGGATAGGALAGTALGGPGGAMVGAGVGYLVKTFGAPATKKILDGVLSIQGMPSVQKLNQALGDIDAKTRQNLVDGFIRANVVGMEKDEPLKTRVEIQAIPQVLDDLKNSQLDSVTKARALTDLQKNGQVDTVILKKYMVGDQPQSKPIVPATSKSETLKEDRPDMLKVLDRIKE